MEEHTFRFPVESALWKRLEKRKINNTFRSFKISPSFCVDFCSNDYLGFSRLPELKKRIRVLEQTYSLPVGSTGSRLLTGNSAFAEDLENKLASFLKSETTLLFNSGYDANSGVFSTLAGKHDIVLYDELVHASIHDGLRISFAASLKFRHNNLQQLEEKLIQFSGKNTFVAVESVYSMDGDFAPLDEISKLCDKYKANLVVDEAHATGVFGDNGEGRVVELGLEEKVFLRVHTFGKAMGSQGAAVACSAVTKEYLVNFCRPLIYTTALPSHSLFSISAAIDMLNGSSIEKSNLIKIIHYFKSAISLNNIPGFIPSDSPVQCIIIPGAGNVKAVSDKCIQEGFDVRPIFSPTVSEGKERLRICLHAFNTEVEIDSLVEILICSDNLFSGSNKMNALAKSR